MKKNYERAIAPKYETRKKEKGKKDERKKKKRD